MDFSKLAATKAVNLVAARRLITNHEASALALLLAAKALAGAEFTEWEPETVWLVLEQKGLSVPGPCRTKVMAAATLSYMPSFFWDGFVMEKTALAFDGHEFNPAALEEATSAQLAWAVLEATRIRQYFEEPVRKFEHEPCAYAGVVLFREGFVLAPEQLEFAQEQLDKSNRDAADLKARVKTRWEVLDKKDLPAHALEETPEGVQLARLCAVAVHVQEREAQLATELTALQVS